MNSLLVSAQESSAAAPTVANHNTKTVFRYIDVLGDPQSHSEAVIREFGTALADSVCVSVSCVCVCKNVYLSRRRHKERSVVESGPPPEAIAARAAKIPTTYCPSSREQRAKVLRNSAWREYACAETLLFHPTDSYYERLTQTMVLQSLYSYTQRDYLAMLQRLASPAIANKNIAS